MSDKQVIAAYKDVALVYGDMLSYLYLGKAVGIDIARKFEVLWARELRRRGFRRPTVNELIESGGYGTELKIERA